MGYAIAKQTAAATSEDIDLTRGPFPITVHQVGLLTTEEIDVYVVDEDGEDLPLYDAYGAPVVFSVTSQPLTIPSPITLKFDKPITANAVGIQVTRISE